MASQTNIKRLLGYSSISHLGYLLVALIALQTGEMSRWKRQELTSPVICSRSPGAPGVASTDVQPVPWPDAGIPVLLPRSVLASPDPRGGDETVM